jgi:hypothetical protein
MGPGCSILLREYVISIEIGSAGVSADPEPVDGEAVSHARGRAGNK